MEKRHSLRFGALTLLVLVAVIIAFYQSGVLRGQLMGGASEILTPVGEAFQIDLSQSWGPSVGFINVTWTPSRTNGSYALMLRDHTTGNLLRKITVSPSALRERGNPSYQLSVNGIVPYTEYRMSVATIDGSIQSPESKPKVFWVGIKDMPSYESQKPEIVAPKGIITFADAIIQWEQMDPRTRKYTIEISEPSDLDAFTVTTRSLSDQRSPSFNITEQKELKIDVEYRYRVIGEDLYGHKSQWSDFGSFTIQDQNFADAKPTLISPIGEQNYFDNTFTWDPIPGAKYYRVEVRGDNNQEAFTRTVLTQNLFDKGHPSVSIPIPKNNQNTYIWYVVAYSLDDTPSQSSEMAQFSSLLGTFQEQKPVVLGPTGTISPENVLFSWQKLPYAVGYNLAVTAGARNYLHRFNAADLTENEGVYEVALPGFTADHGAEYSSMVTAFDATYVYSQPSDPLSFRTRDNDFLSVVPEIIGPKGTVSSFDGAVRWKAVSGAKDYRVSVTSQDPAKPFSYNAYILVSNLENASSPSWTIPNISRAAGARYSFRIQARNMQGFHSQMSERAMFDVELPAFTRIMPELISPSGVIPRSEDQPTILKWKAVIGAEAYIVTLHGGDGTDAEFEVMVADLADKTRPSLAFDPALSVANATFAFRVQARNAEGILSQLSQPLNFSFDASSFSKVVPNGLAPVQSVKTPDVTLTWKPITRAEAYEVELKENQGNSSLTTVNVSDLTDPNAPKLMKSFAIGKRIDFRVRGLKDAGTDMTQWSAWANFTIDTPSISKTLPLVTGPLSGSSNTSSITWNAVPGAISYDVWLRNYTFGSDTTLVHRSYAVGVLSNANAPSLNLGVFKPGGIYMIWIRAEKQVSDGAKKELSPWSKGFAFVADVGTHGENVDGKLSTVKPVITFPTTPAALMPVIAWQAVPKAGSYELFIQNNTAKRIEKVTALAGNVTSYKPTYNLTPGGSYTVWIRAIGGGEFSAWSVAKTFTVQK